MNVILFQILGLCLLVTYFLTRELQFLIAFNILLSLIILFFVYKLYISLAGILEVMISNNKEKDSK